jgi:hypothetical protein
MFRPKTELKSDMDKLKELLNSPNIDKETKEKVSLFINKEIIKKQKCPVCNNMTEQKAILDFYANINVEINKLFENRIKRLK